MVAKTKSKLILKDCVINPIITLNNCCRERPSGSLFGPSEGTLSRVLICTTCHWLLVPPAAHYLGYLTSQLVWLHCEVLFCLGEHFRAFFIVLSTLWSTGSVWLLLIDCRLPSDLSLGLWPLYPVSLPALTLCLVMFTYVRRLPRSWNCLTILILSVPLYSSGFALCCDWNFSCLINKLQMDSSASSDSLQ